MDSDVLCKGSQKSNKPVSCLTYVPNIMLFNSIRFLWQLSFYYYLHFVDTKWNLSQGWSLAQGHSTLSGKTGIWAQIKLASKSEIVPLPQAGSLHMWRHLMCDTAPTPVWSHIKLANQVRGPSCVVRRNLDHGTETNETAMEEEIYWAAFLILCVWITHQAVVPRSVAEGKLQRWNHHSLGKQHLVAQTVMVHHSICLCSRIVSKVRFSLLRVRIPDTGRLTETLWIARG